MQFLHTSNWARELQGLFSLFLYKEIVCVYSLKTLLVRITHVLTLLSPFSPEWLGQMILWPSLLKKGYCSKQ
ncbi:hypothetical protein AYI68_g7538 [Smittium mucronatum]|uniref:Uncharacterized protein n=1 Tax=Smittium mucronatum TaxID=133383 RepID=A0A1R0GNE5_9FUNG|nr:hypothetical protein AYI68_g7538 [Smittium mucronatum]